MADVKISQLSRIPISAGTASYPHEVSFPVVSNNASYQISLDDIESRIKKSLGFVDQPLVKCRHCGQWGAVYCACRYCGAPIDPQ